MTDAGSGLATSAEAPLSRFAEAIFWLARYVERAENLARIIDVQETFARDRLGASNWRSIVQLQADEAQFSAGHAAVSAATVIEIYILDAANPHSVKSSIALARANARALRPSISTEMWTQLNMFHNWLQALGADDVALPDVSRLCARIKEGCQTHYGITEGTFYRHQGWQFYRLGKAIERADQTTRLLDIKYHLLLPTPDTIGSPTDESQWNALLRAGRRLPRLPPRPAARYQPRPGRRLPVVRSELPAHDQGQRHRGGRATGDPAPRLPAAPRRGRRARRRTTHRIR